MEVANREEIMSRLQCPVCLEIPLKGKLLQCPNRHQICDPCYRRLLKPRTCPMCRSAFDKARLEASRDLNKMLGRIELKCRNEGCSVVLRRGKLRSHQKKCKVSTETTVAIQTVSRGSQNDRISSDNLAAPERQLVERSRSHRYNQAENTTSPEPQECRLLSALRRHSLTLLLLLLSYCQEGFFCSALACGFHCLGVAAVAFRPKLDPGEEDTSLAEKLIWFLIGCFVEGILLVAAACLLSVAVPAFWVGVAALSSDFAATYRHYPIVATLVGLGALLLRGETPPPDVVKGHGAFCLCALGCWLAFLAENSWVQLLNACCVMVSWWLCFIPFCCIRYARDDTSSEVLAVLLLAGSIAGSLLLVLF